MELTIQTTQDSNDTISLVKLDDSIMLTVMRLGNAIALDLSAFEAQTIAGALLQMAGRLESHSGDVLDEEAMTKQAINIDTLEREKKARLERQKEIALREVILSYRDDYRGKYVTMNTTGFYASNETWAKERHLQGEHERNEPSCVNLKKDENGDWWLVDCLPF